MTFPCGICLLDCTASAQRVRCGGVGSSVLHFFICIDTAVSMCNLRWQHIAILALTSWLLACTSAKQSSTSSPQLEVVATPSIASETLSPGVRSECNVAPDSIRSQYIIGYGSLMQDESRKRTSPEAGSAHPVEAKGYRRGWFSRAQTVGFGTTYLGALPDRSSRINAVIYQVDPVELIATDRRELSYCRASVAISEITPLEKDFLPDPNGQIWIYISMPQSVAIPNSQYPIVQSYVDIFVSGCLEQEQRFGPVEFAQQCLSTTTNWSEHWVNDRIYPRRPFNFQPKARQIYNLLSKQLQQYFSHIRIEGG